MWGSVTHWNSFVANLEMHGKRTFYDPLLNVAAQFPIAVRAGFRNARNVDLTSLTSRPRILPFIVLAMTATRSEACFKNFRRSRASNSEPSS
jgi:hypothetical protein